MRPAAQRNNAGFSIALRVSRLLTSAPASSDQWAPSRVAVAVSPAALEPVPVVITDRGASFAAHFRNCDLPA